MPIEPASEIWKEASCNAVVGRALFYRPKFRRRRQAVSESDYFRQAEAQYAPRRHHLYVNTPAARVIERAIAETAPEMRGSYLGGVTLGPRESSLAEASLRALVENETHPEIRAALQHVAEEFSRASSHHQIVTIVNADPAVSTSEVREIEREEEVHRAVIEAVGGTFSLQFVARLVEDRDFAAALRRLRRIRPDMTTPLQEVNELAALLMQGNWETIGLTDNQAGSLWYSFARLMIEHHGERAKAILRHGHPVHAKQVARRIREEMGEAVPPPHGTKH